MLKVMFVVGPTASGKSELALQMALERRGVIVNCDSVQVYAHVQIGAAKPSSEEMRSVPHYLYGHVFPLQEYTAGEYRRDFFNLLTKLEREGVEDAIVVGGTGFYFQAIEKGMFETQPPPLEIKEELLLQAQTEEGVSVLYRELEAFDPVFAGKIHRNDRYRILRGLEMIRAFGQKPSELWKQKLESPSVFPYPLEKIGIFWERHQLHERIHRRVQKMLAGGLIEEVLDLNKMSLQSWAPLKSVGYKEVEDYLDGKIKTLAELEEKILISTRQLAKRQSTWFKRDQEIRWITKPH